MMYGLDCGGKKKTLQGRGRWNFKARLCKILRILLGGNYIERIEEGVLIHAYSQKR